MKLRIRDLMMTIIEDNGGKYKIHYICMKLWKNNWKDLSANNLMSQWNFQWYSHGLVPDLRKLSDFSYWV